MEKVLFQPNFMDGKTKSSVQFSRSVVSNSLWPHELQHARLPCPSPTPGAHPTHVHWVGDAIQPSHPLSSPFPPALNLSQHQVFSNESALRIRWPNLRVVQKLTNIAQLGSGRASSWICSQWTHHTTAQTTHSQERVLTPGQGSRLFSSQWSPNIRYKETKLEIPRYYLSKPEIPRY